MAQAQAQPRQRPGAAAGAAAAVAVPTVVLPAASGAAGAGASVAAMGALGVTSAGVMAALASFFSVLRRREQARLTVELRSQGVAPAAVPDIMGEHERFLRLFARNSTARVHAQMTAALAIEDPVERQAAIRKIMDAEERYARQQVAMSVARSAARVDQARVRAASPEGAFWLLGHVRTKHCERCLALAGRAWSWDFLQSVRPPVHGHCACSLIGLQDALERGLMTAGQGAAFGVAPAALVAELDVRVALLEAGVSAETLEGLPWLGVLSIREGVRNGAAEAVSEPA